MAGNIVSAGRSVSGRAAFPSQSLSRGTVFAAAGILAALNAQADQILNTFVYEPPLEGIAGLAGISAVIWAAMAASWKIGTESAESLRPGRDLTVLAVVILLCFVPVSYSAQLGLLVCGAYLASTSRAGEPERRAALVLLALTGPLIWGRLLLHALEVPILSLDAHLVGTATGTPVDGNVVHFAGTSGHFIIGGPCSSVHNMSLAIVLWTTAAMLFRIRIDRPYVFVGCAMAAFMFALNILRLSAMALFPDQFDFLHSGTGAVVFSWAGLVGAGALAILGVSHAVARQQH